ncbi:TetR family transcriptional regulator [Microbacterium sp. zg.B48]|uniref:TetR/AcrR family transcriptional regulator n=1 Tax=unclassified Microbacterium TaxID=2609290 RepID=UPI00214AEC30|nr:MULTISPECIES: TetR family transcriptional regulator [unclassified Microbacterium]MCR2764766.1 TetR family transcriptional regulator [Microbacterium sp. zg.B48]MCR2810096.1 TetR family transcriptional regulator [Microbacterium sp. zg.B185]WIM20067.1 TetR family transcriptional regulator [Microbacterium sp. zg-B185]
MPDQRSSRRYSSALRTEQAAATRARIVAAAAELFAARGYAGTSMPEIARNAGVSPETVQSHGPKSALLRAAIDAFAFGAGRDADARETALGEQMLSARTAAEAAAVAAEVLTQVNSATHGLWLAFAEAARTDAEIAEAFGQLAAGIRAQNVTLMQEWMARGFARDDLGLDDLVDRAVLIGSVELYDRAVRVGGMSVGQYRRLLAAMLGELLVAS